MPLPGLERALLVALAVTGPYAGVARSQTAPGPQETLEQEFTDPLTTLPQLFLKDAYSPVNYGTRVQTNQLIARAIVPRIPPYTLLPFPQLVRPTVSLVTVSSPKGGTRTDFGDTQSFDLAGRLGRRRKRASGLGWDPPSCFQRPPPRAPVKGRGRPVRPSPPFIRALEGCYWGSFYRIRSPSPSRSSGKASRGRYR